MSRGIFRVMCLPDCVVDITRTSDGFWLARDAGDIGFNRFLGRPNRRPPGSPGTVWAWKEFRKLTMPERRGVVTDARIKGVELRAFLPRGG